ncbi:MAG: GNAT family N-acetyltransferase [Cryomorphaceae bacterium]|nr:GNAT family N-acetyltransferase [Cryomorphaceae bacterium]
MTETAIYNTTNRPSQLSKKQLIDFLYEHLQEYGDPRADIEKAVNYALKEVPSFGGFIVVSRQDKQLTGAVVVNQTGMVDYIPENILVYIATHKAHRGKGIGKVLMRKTIEMAKGAIALHVEPDNPARRLYEKMGFGSKYIEMRYKKEEN